MTDKTAETMPKPAEKTTVGDLLGKTVPALSATSDMPVVEKPADTQAEAAKADDAKPVDGDVKPDAAEGEAKAEADAKAEGEGDAKKAKKGVSERIGEITAQRKAAEKRADEALAVAKQQTEALTTALKKIEELTGKSASEAAAKVEADDPQPTMPKRETFETPEAYDRALAEHNAQLVQWATRQATRVAKAESQKEAAEKTKADDAARVKKQQEDEGKALAESWAEKTSKAKEKYDDYDSVALNDDLPVNQAMGAAIMQADNGADVLYWLGQNHDQAKRISGLTPMQVAIEIGRISASLENTKPEVSKAAEPIKPVGSKSNATSKAPGEMSMDEYAAMRNQQLRVSRQPIIGRQRPN